MRVLVHICCAPCALMPVRGLLEEGCDLRGLYYNPNIQPYTENQRRLATLKDWAGDQGLDLIVQDEYKPEKWLRKVAFREEMRCRICYHDRLTRAAQVAKRGKFDAFTTTLLYSVRQKHEMLRELGEAVAAERDIKFLYRDFRPHWREGIQLSKKLGLYRQAYCGCLFSERDRYLGAGAKSRQIHTPAER